MERNIFIKNRKENQNRDIIVVTQDNKLLIYKLQALQSKKVLYLEENHKALYNSAPHFLITPTTYPRKNVILQISKRNRKRLNINGTMFF